MESVAPLSQRTNQQPAISQRQSLSKCGQLLLRRQTVSVYILTAFTSIGVHVCLAQSDAVSACMGFLCEQEQLHADTYKHHLSLESI